MSNKSKLYLQIMVIHKNVSIIMKKSHVGEQTNTGMAIFLKLCWKIYPSIFSTKLLLI